MRLADITEQNGDEAALRERLIARRGAVVGPFQALVRSPRLCEHLETLSTYCMRESALPLRLRELTLLIAARAFDAQHSWNAHFEKAVAAGVDRASLERLARRQDPDFTRSDERILHRFATEALLGHFVDDDTYAAALAEFGESALVDLVASLGTFTTLAMVLNTFQIDLDPAHEPPFPDVRDFRRIGPDRKAQQ
ncbi:carboxymuconolactone decarboxylase family protein [Streptomyces canus]|uniref:carboxymuconolactone decarboxylase family protein n=1 Tax=Streptomyces canus TaxID=58343 RepID=UPI0036A0F7CD